MSANYDIDLEKINDELVDGADQKYSELIKGLDTADGEKAHYQADKLIIHLIERLGFNKTAEAWKNVSKWYA